jgi:hypothetical protein
MILKHWAKALIESIEDYRTTGEITVVEGWTTKDTVKGKFGAFSVFVTGMIFLLPFVIVITIIQIPIYLIGNAVLKIYEIFSKLVRGE